MVAYYYPCRREEITSVHSAEASFISRFLQRTFRVGTVCIMTGVPHDHLMQQNESLCQSDQMESGRDGRRLELWNERLQSHCVTAHLQSDAMVQLGEATCLPSTTSNKAKHPHAERQHTNKQTNKCKVWVLHARAIRPRCGYSIRVFGVPLPPPVHAQNRKPKNRGFNFLMCTHHSCSILLAAIAKGTVTVQQSTCASCLFLFLFFSHRAPPLFFWPAFTCSGAGPEPRSNGEMEAAGETHSSPVHLASCPACVNPNQRVSQLAGPPAKRNQQRETPSYSSETRETKMHMFFVLLCFAKAEAEPAAPSISRDLRVGCVLCQASSSPAPSSFFLQPTAGLDCSRSHNP